MTIPPNRASRFALRWRLEPFLMAAWPLLGIGMAGLLFVYLILGIAGLVALLLLLLAATAMFFLDARRSAGKVF